MKILIWPGFSVVGLEIAEQLRFMKDVQIFSGTSEIHHPLSEMFAGVVEVPSLKTSLVLPDARVLEDYVVFPAHDYVLDYICSNSNQINWIGSNRETIQLTRNKKTMYEFLDENLSDISPLTFKSRAEAELNFPFYAKPIAGYGSIGHHLVESSGELDLLSISEESHVLMEVLNGEEFTIECFSSAEGELIHSRARRRLRVRMGTSLSFEAPSAEINAILESFANDINNSLKLNGPWYFQVKARGALQHDNKVLEVSTRLPGSSVWSRANGVNLAEIAIWNYRMKDVKAIENTSEVLLERDLASKMMLKQSFDHVYVDLDDTILINGRVNHWGIAFIIQEKNKGKEIHLISKSLAPDIIAVLSAHQILGLFDSISHLTVSDSKSLYIKHKSSIFIDDSFTERHQIIEQLGIPCFGPDIFQLMVK